MAIKVLSLAENGYRRLANAITVTILMHTTFSPFDRRAIFVFFSSSFLSHCNEPSHFRLFSSSFLNLCNKRKHLKWLFPEFQSCVHASLDKLGWKGASFSKIFVHAKKRSRVTRLTYNCAHLRLTKESLTFEYDIWWYWVSRRRYWLVLGGTGSVWGGTGWYLVVLGQYNFVLLGIKWY